ATAPPSRALPTSPRRTGAAGMAEAALPARVAAGDSLLAVRDLHAWYDESHVLHGVEFDVPPGEVVTLLGRNGAGKTTAVKALMGLVRRPRRPRPVPRAHRTGGA